MADMHPDLDGIDELLAPARDAWRTGWCGAMHVDRTRSLTEIDEHLDERQLVRT